MLITLLGEKKEFAFSHGSKSECVAAGESIANDIYIYIFFFYELTAIQALFNSRFFSCKRVFRVEILIIRQFARTKIPSLVE